VVLFIQSTFNNTIVTITNLTGDTSGLQQEVQGSKESKVPFAASNSGRKSSFRGFAGGMKNVEILVKGQGSGTRNSNSSNEGGGFDIISTQDITSVPQYNGCRPPKRRRLETLFLIN
jgi:small subunit ribosomal protein S11